MICFLYAFLPSISSLIPCAVMYHFTVSSSFSLTSPYIIIVNSVFLNFYGPRTGIRKQSEELTWPRTSRMQRPPKKHRTKHWLNTLKQNKIVSRKISRINDNRSDWFIWKIQTGNLFKNFVSSHRKLYMVVLCSLNIIYHISSLKSLQK